VPPARRVVLLGALTVVVAACGGETTVTVTDESTVTLSAEPVTVTIAADSAAEPTASSLEAELEAEGEDATEAADDEDAPAETESATETQSLAGSGEVVVEQSQIFYMPNQIGGKYHVVVALVRNETGSATTVTGQFTITKGGTLLGTADPTPINLQPGAEGALLADAVDLPRPARGRDVTVDVAIAFDEPFVDVSTIDAFTVRAARYRPTGGVFSCTLSATVTSALDEKANTRVTLVGMRGNAIATAAYSYDDFFPGAPKVVKVDQPSDALCPKKVDEVRVFVEPPF
jgi:hypothetical protein